MYLAVDDIKTNPVIIVVWENKYIMLSKRTLYSFISFRFVKLALPREHKSQKENVFEKKRRNKFGNFFLSQVSPDGRPIFSRTVCYIGDLFGATPVLNLWRFHIFAVLFIKIELEFQSQKFPRIQALYSKLWQRKCIAHVVSFPKQLRVLLFVCGVGQTSHVHMKLKQNSAKLPPYHMKGTTLAEHYRRAHLTSAEDLLLSGWQLKRCEVCPLSWASSSCSCSWSTLKLNRGHFHTSSSWFLLAGFKLFSFSVKLFNRVLNSDIKQSCYWSVWRCFWKRNDRSWISSQPTPSQTAL